MTVWVGALLILIAILTGVLAIRNVDSALKPKPPIEKRKNPFVFQFYKKFSFYSLFTGIGLIAFHFAGFQFWSQEVDSKITVYALLVIVISSVYVVAQTFVNNKRIRDIKYRIKKLEQHRDPNQCKKKVTH